MPDANREALKSLVNNIINDKTDEANLDFSNYITAKAQQVAGINTTVTAEKTDEYGE